MAQALKVAVQMDPIEHINIDADSTFALMLEAQRRGHALWHYEVRHMALREGVRRQGERREERLSARARPVSAARARPAAPPPPPASPRRPAPAPPHPQWAIPFCSILEKGGWC